jgi:diacylglycerol kinase
LSVAEEDSHGEDADGSSNGPSLTPVETWRDESSWGDLKNIFHSLNGLWNHIYFPKPTKKNKRDGIKPSGRTIRRFTFVCIAVIVAAKVWRHMSYTHWAIVIVSSFFILSVEGINTAIEIICDWLQPKTDPNVKAIKDASAGAVLIAAIGVAIIWSLMFWHPR